MTPEEQVLMLLEEIDTERRDWFRLFGAILLQHGGELRLRNETLVRLPHRFAIQSHEDIATMEQVFTLVPLDSAVRKPKIDNYGDPAGGGFRA